MGTLQGELYCMYKGDNAFIPLSHTQYFIHFLSTAVNVRRYIHVVCICMHTLMQCNNKRTHKKSAIVSQKEAGRGGILHTKAKKPHRQGAKNTSHEARSTKQTNAAACLVRATRIMVFFRFKVTEAIVFAIPCHVTVPPKRVSSTSGCFWS